jgi:integrase
MKVPEPRKLPSGTYFIQLRLNGVSVPVSADSAKECARQAELIKAEHRAGTRKIAKKSSMLLKDACTAYIEERRPILKPSTIQGYEKIRDQNFQSLMQTPLKKIDFDLVEKSISEESARISERGKKMSPKTVKNAYCFVASVLKKNHVRLDDQPALPEVQRKPLQIIPAEDVYRAVKGSDIELPCLLAMWLTMSISEIRGLTKSKSIRNGQVTILETIVDIKGKPVREEGGKEELRTRTQALPAYISALIDQVDGDVICPMSSQAVNKKLQRLLVKAGLPVISFHKLRHISASTMALLQIPGNCIQEKGGWKSDYTMKAVYTHTFTQERLDADKKMSDLFDGIIKNANENANKQANT